MMDKPSILEERISQYGPFTKNAACTARMWTAYLRARYGEHIPSLSSDDVAMMQVLLKVSREAAYPGGTEDNLIDIHGYIDLYREESPKHHDRKDPQQDFDPFPYP